MEPSPPFHGTCWATLCFARFACPEAMYAGQRFAFRACLRNSTPISRAAIAFPQLHPRMTLLLWSWRSANWQGAESDPASLRDLIQADEDAGFVHKASQAHFGVDRVAIGRVNLVQNYTRQKAPQKAPLSRRLFGVQRISSLHSAREGVSLCRKLYFAPSECLLEKGFHFSPAQEPSGKELCVGHSASHQRSLANLSCAAGVYHFHPQAVRTASRLFQSSAQPSGWPSLVILGIRLRGGRTQPDPIVWTLPCNPSAGVRIK